MDSRLSRAARRSPLRRPRKATCSPRHRMGSRNLTGFWTSATFTPLQRPASVKKELYTLDEVLAAEKAAAAREDEQTVPGTEDDVHYDGTQFGLGKTQGTYIRNLRTGLITDPPDGRIPPLSDQGKQRLAQRDADLKRRGILITNRTELNSIVGRNTRYDQAQNNSLDDRCIITGQAGPPMVPGGYNSGYQFVQSPGWVMGTHREQSHRSHDSDRWPAGPSTERARGGRGSHAAIGKGIRSSSRPRTSRPTLRSLATPSRLSGTEIPSWRTPAPFSSMRATRVIVR